MFLIGVLKVMPCNSNQTLKVNEQQQQLKDASERLEEAQRKQEDDPLLSLSTGVVSIVFPYCF